MAQHSREVTEGEDLSLPRVGWGEARESRLLSGVGWNSPAPWGTWRRQGFVLGVRGAQTGLGSWWLLSWAHRHGHCLAPSLDLLDLRALAGPGRAQRLLPLLFGVPALGEPVCCPALSPWSRDTLSFCLPCLPRALLGFKNILSQTLSKDTNLLVCSLTPRAAYGTSYNPKRPFGHQRHKNSKGSAWNFRLSLYF